MIEHEDDLRGMLPDEILVEVNRILALNAAVATENARLRAVVEEVAAGCGHRRCHAHRWIVLAREVLR
jgi:hypothetical protein